MRQNWDKKGIELRIDMCYNSIIKNYILMNEERIKQIDFAPFSVFKKGKVNIFCEKNIYVQR